MGREREREREKERERERESVCVCERQGMFLLQSDDSWQRKLFVLGHDLCDSPESLISGGKCPGTHGQQGREV